MAHPFCGTGKRTRHELFNGVTTDLIASSKSLLSRADWQATAWKRRGSDCLALELVHPDAPVSQRP